MTILIWLADLTWSADLFSLICWSADQADQQLIWPADKKVLDIFFLKTILEKFFWMISSTDLISWSSDKKLFFFSKFNFLIFFEWSVQLIWPDQLIRLINSWSDQQTQKLNFFSKNILKRKTFFEWSDQLSKKKSIFFQFFFKNIFWKISWSNNLFRW